MSKVSAIVCVSPDGGIGRLDGSLLYKNPIDMAFFSGFTQGKVLLVGYNTMRTLPKLINRIPSLDHRKIVQDLGWKARVNQCDVVVIGGAKTYAKYADQVQELFVTHMEIPPEVEAEVFFNVDDYAHLNYKGNVFKNKNFTIRRYA